MAIKFISCTKRFFKVHEWISALFVGGLLVIALTACTDESSTRTEITPPEEMYSICITDMSLHEIYDEVCAILGDTIGDHGLTRVEGIFETKDGQICYDSLELYFERSVGGNSEGGRISVLSITFDQTEGTDAVRIINFIGPSKAFWGTGIALFTDDNTFELVEEEFLAQSFDKPMGFEVWRSMTNLSENQGKGKPDIWIYDVVQDGNI